jgi:hypothetical protein
MVPLAQGDVLEIGVGPGVNFPVLEVVSRSIAIIGKTITACQNSKSIENCNCLGIPALFGVANVGSGDICVP